MDLSTLGASTFAIAFATGRWEPETTALVSRLVANGDVFVDIGSNVGYFARVAADLVGTEGRVYAFEPESSNFAALLSNTKAHSQVQAIPAAIGAPDGLQPLFRSRLGCNSLVVSPDRFRWVPTVNFDTFVDASGLSKISVVKIDAEGNEPAVLAGMRRSIEKGIVRALIIEYAPQYMRLAGCEPQPFVESLLTRYQVTVIERQKYESTPDALTFDALHELTDKMCADTDPMACVNLLAVVREPAESSAEVV